ncbi:MAG: LacI family DNA-binding transcriptional regulator [Ornithinibacter sp.]
MASSGETRRGVTIYSVADRAGVSIATVSRVLHGSATVSERTRLKVLEAADDLAYLPSGAARSLAARHHATYGLVLPELKGPYYADLLVGFEGRAAELSRSVMVVIAGTKGDCGPAVRTLASRVDGIAVLGADAHSLDAWLKPVVIIAGEARPGVEAVSTENTESARYLTEHLLRHGRKRLLFVGDPDGALDVHERHAGFLRAHEDNGITPADPVRAEFCEEEGAAIAERVIAGEHDTDALVCGNDELALAIMTGLIDAGIDVPGDIAVVGWDDVMTARYVRPGLTTVRQPVKLVGALAAERLHDLVNGSVPSGERRVLPTEVVIRSSCGCPPRPVDGERPAPRLGAASPKTPPHH